MNTIEERVAHVWKSDQRLQIDRAVLLGYAATLSQQLFDERRSALTVHESESGLTVLSCQPPLDPEEEQRSLLAAHRNPDGRVIVEAHNYLYNMNDPTRQTKRRCSGVSLDLEASSTSITYRLRHDDRYNAETGRVSKLAAEIVPMDWEPHRTYISAIGIHALALLLEAEPYTDPFYPNRIRARRSLTETHPHAPTLAKKFISDEIQAVVRTALADIQP